MPLTMSTGSSSKELGADDCPDLAPISSMPIIIVRSFSSRKEGRKEGRFIQGTIRAHQDQYPISVLSTCAIHTATETLDILTALKTCNYVQEPLTVSEI